MANKPFGIEELNIVGSAGTSLIEAVADLHIRVGGGRTVGIGTSGFNIQDGKADVNNDSVLNVGIVTANEYYGTFKGTIDPGTSTISVASSLTDVIGVNANQIYPKIASEDSILFWDFSETKTTYLKIGDGVTIDGDTLKGDYTLPLTGTSGDAGVGEAIWTLTPSSGTGDPVKLKAGSNVSIDATSVGSGEFTLNVASGAGITFTGIDVKQYSDNLSPTRTERTCADPIVVDIASNTATIAIGNTSNAYGERYIQTTEPTTSCDGDIWYDTTPPAGGGGTGITIEDEGVALTTLATTLNFTGSGVVASGTGATKTITISGDGTSDGDKGDITVSSSGTVWSIDDDVVEEKHINAGGSPAADKVLVYDAAESTNWKWATQSATTSASTTRLARVEEIGTDYTSQAGAFTASTWITRSLTNLTDPHSIGISLNTTDDYITIPAGTYSLRWSAPALNCIRHVARLLYSNASSFSFSSASTTAVYAPVAYTDSNQVQTRSTGFLPSVTFTGTTYIKVEHYTDNGNSSGDGMGVSSPWSGEVANASSKPIWTTIEIEDLATAIKEPTGSEIPVGGIIMYSGSQTELNALTNWKLCDGTNGTPNLKDKFVIGADSYNSGDSKWETNVTGSGTQTGGHKNAVLPKHDHSKGTYDLANNGSHNHAFKASNRAGDIDPWSNTNKAFIGDVDAAAFTQAADTDKIYDNGSHSHSLSGKSGIRGLDVDGENDSNQTGTNMNLPPYFSLAYIMRIS